MGRIGGFLTCLLGGVLLGGPLVGAETCLRQTSRDVREVLRKKVFERLDINHSSLPDECLLRLDADIFYDHEQHKTIESHSGYHKCLYCNKTFRSEKYLDRHMEKKHMDMLSPDRHFCLSDLAPILGVRPRGDRAQTARGSMWGLAFNSPSPASRCSAAVIEKLAYKCASIARSCFGRSETGELGRFVSLVCDSLRCEHGQLMGVGDMAGSSQDGGWDILLLLLRVIVISVLLVGLVLFAVSRYPSWTGGRAGYNSRHRERSALGRRFDLNSLFYKLKRL